METRADTYQLRLVMLLASVGSLAVIFAMLFVQYLFSSSEHWPATIDTIGEMMRYAEFFFMVFASFFSSSFLIWRFRETFGKLTDSWIPIVFLGSISLVTFFFLRIILSVGFRYRTSSFSTVEVGLIDVVSWAAAYMVAVIVISGIPCFLVSLIDKERNQTGQEFTKKY